MLGFADFLEFEFLQMALFGVFLLALITGALSPLVVAKRYAFLGEALGHSTLVSATLSYMLLGGSAEEIVFLPTLGITLLLTLFLAYSSYKQKIPSDSMIGIFLSSTLALGVILHSLYLKGEVEIERLLFGSILTLSIFDLTLLTILMIITLLTLYLKRRKWLLYAIEENTAHLYGVNTKIYHFGLYILLTLTIVAGINISGTVLVTALLVIPGSVALRLGKGLRQSFLLSIGFSLICCLSGLILANYMNLPPGATMAFAQFLLFAFLLIVNKIKRQP